MSAAARFTAEVFCDGTTGPLRLSHPECVAVDAAGDLWCGGDRGEIYRVAADGSAFEQVASTGGFVLGVALDGAGFLYACDLAERAVFRVAVAGAAGAAGSDGAGGAAGAGGAVVERFADGGGAMRIPNFAVVDARRGCLYVSDSHDPARPGPGIWRVALDGGRCELWHPGPFTFANGMALTAAGDALYVVETWARRIVRLPISADGAAGAPEPVVETPDALPDGIALDADGRLYVACYEPSRIYRFDPRAPHAGLELLLDDPTAHVLCHPTNCAFRGEELLVANLGRWHIARARVDATGLALPGQR